MHRAPAPARLGGRTPGLQRVRELPLERVRVEGTCPKYVKAGTGLRSHVLYDRRDLRDWLVGAVAPVRHVIEDSLTISQLANC